MLNTWLVPMAIPQHSKFWEKTLLSKKWCCICNSNVLLKGWVWDYLSCYVCLSFFFSFCRFFLFRIFQYYQCNVVCLSLARPKSVLKMLFFPSYLFFFLFTIFFVGLMCMIHNGLDWYLLESSLIIWSVSTQAKIDTIALVLKVNN